VKEVTGVKGIFVEGGSQVMTILVVVGVIQRVRERCVFLQVGRLRTRAQRG
jgi:hypothetical protein